MPKVKDGGILCGHDYSSQKDVRMAVDELLPDAEHNTGCTGHVEDWMIVKKGKK